MNTLSQDLNIVNEVRRYWHWIGFVWVFDLYDFVVIKNFVVTYMKKKTHFKKNRTIFCKEDLKINCCKPSGFILGPWGLLTPGLGTTAIGFSVNRTHTWSMIYIRHRAAKRTNLIYKMSDNSEKCCQKCLKLRVMPSGVLFLTNSPKLEDI